MVIIEIQQKMHLFATRHARRVVRRSNGKYVRQVNSHKPETKGRDEWQQIMEEVFCNFTSMCQTGSDATEKVHRYRRSGFERLVYCFRPFARCMLKWCVEEDCSINTDFVDILTDVETHMADTVRFVLQHVENGAASFDGKDFGNIDHLLPRMAKACLHVLTADSSPPNFDTSYDSLDYYGFYIKCQGSTWGKFPSQITNVIALREFIRRSTDEIHGQEMLISLESLYDKVASHVLLGSWESYYNMYLSGPDINMDVSFDAWIQKVSALPLDAASPVAVWSDKTLKTYSDHVQQIAKQLQIGQDDIDLTLAVKDQLKMLCRELAIIVNVHTNSPPQLQAEQGSNLTDERIEVQGLARSIESLCFLCFTTQTEDLNLVVAAAAEKKGLGIRNLLASIITDRVMRLTSSMSIPLTREFLIEFMEGVQKFMSQVLEDENIIQTNPVKDQLEMFRIDLGFFVNFDGYYTETGEVQTVANNLESFIYSFITQTENIILVSAAAATVILGLQHLLASVLKTSILRLSCAIVPLPDGVLLNFMKFVQRYLSGMSKVDSIIPGPLRVQLEFLQYEMGNLVHFHITYLPVAVRMEVQTVVMNTASFVNSTMISQAKQDATETILGVRNLLASILTAWLVKLTINAREYSEPTKRFPLSDLVEKFAHLKVDVVQDIIFLIIVCKIIPVTPVTNQLAFVSCLLDNMKESVNGGADLDEFKTIHDAIFLFRDFLQSMTNYSIAYSHDICELVVNVAREAEYLMYSLSVGTYSASCRNRWIYHFSQHVELTKASALDILEKKETDGDWNHVPSQALVPIIDLVIGFEDEMQRVKKILVASQHVKQLDVVSVIGMPGLGKTTLARKVYEDRQIADHFQIRAWCVVSNEYNKKDLLLTILGCMIELTDILQKMNEAEISTLLHKQLMGRRYLVVMDDVWGIDAFEGLKVYLPENKNGSRILLTSRNRVIGVKAKHHSDLLELRMLTSEESWVLLSKKVYLNQECPSELCQVGKRIAESCRGLPLAIVVVAGLLAKSSMMREFWEQVSENLSSYISHDSQAQGMAVLDLSYSHLPRHLKPLFLYTGAFPEDREIPIDNLIWLWIAEGFVRDNKHRSLEHQAELYLMELIDRSFLMVAARKSDGRAKTCIVHDLLRDMSLHKAKEEHLLGQISLSDDLPDPIADQKRLSILLRRKETGTPTHSIFDGAPMRPFIAYEDISTISLAPPLYSFLFFNKNKSLPMWKEAVASVLCDLKLLRILHFESTSIDDNLRDDVMMLVHMRYISIRAAWTSIPSSVSKLLNLETLIIKGLRGEIEVPDAIWELVMLRHLHVNDRAKFNGLSDKSSLLENLETLSTPTIRRGEDVKLLKRVPNVRKIRCIFLDSCPELKSPNKLESLKVIFTGIGRCPGSFVVPSTLKKLSLSKFRLKWEAVSVFQKLPQLEILNLRIGAIDGEWWNMDDEEEEGFVKLKVLKLESLNIKRWTACAYNFPCLEKLVLKKCKQLMEIPSELGEINALQRMEVLLCSNAAAVSAKNIEEEQKDAGNESLEVHIYSPANLGSSF